MERELGLSRLCDIMARLRAEGGCPWDREQDLRSLRPYLIEEAYEVLDEMDRVSSGGEWRTLCEELGDLLFQIVFHAQLASEVSAFSMADVCRAISEKIERRHPHVFGEKKLSSADEVLDNWAKLKAEERRKKTGSYGSVLDGVPTDAPALLRAERLTEKASRIGFDWPNLEGAWAKLEEELAELQEALDSGDRDAIEHELGDALFSLVNVSRFAKSPPEDALRGANRRFTSRFVRMEEKLRERGIAFGQATLAELDGLWREAKDEEKLTPPPRAIPRAGLMRLELPVGDTEGQEKFWQKLSKIIGWSQVRSTERLAFTDGALIVAFPRGAPAVAPEGPAFFLEAPSPRAVDALARELGELRPMLGTSAYMVAFRDPAGYRWSYGSHIERNVHTSDAM